MGIFASMDCSFQIVRPNQLRQSSRGFNSQSTSSFQMARKLSISIKIPTMKTMTRMATDQLSRSPRKIDTRSSLPSTTFASVTKSSPMCLPNRSHRASAVSIMTADISWSIGWRSKRCGKKLMRCQHLFGPPKMYGSVSRHLSEPLRPGPMWGISWQNTSFRSGCRSGISYQHMWMQLPKIMTVSDPPRTILSSWKIPILSKLRYVGRISSV
mmetsp:Transcript_15324/g.34365  ORF Transcript_15324/g.34365 Transcript_15324/m.34365 type:complete len:212 (-) Transcript_15324:1267-1902(-)